MAHGYADATVTIKGELVPKHCVAAVEVDHDLDLPGMCVVILNNSTGQRFSETVNPHDSIEVAIESMGGDDPHVIFKGEVVGLEPQFSVNGESRCVVRAYDKLHRLTRVCDSETYVNMTDGEIVQKIAEKHGITVEISGKLFKHGHVYRHNQTCFEFLVQRARRCNFELLVEDDKLIFRERVLALRGPPIVLRLGDASERHVVSVKSFSPRLSSVSPVAAVHVRSAAHGKKILGKAEEDEVPNLGEMSGISFAKKFVPDKLVVTYDQPVDSLEEANTYAKSMLVDKALTYIVADARCKGDPRVRHGRLVEVEVNDRRFDGKYYITSVSHQYRHSDGAGGGYHTNFKCCRSAAGA